MSTAISEWVDYIKDKWEEIPWIKAGAILGLAFIGLHGLNQNLPVGVVVDLSNIDKVHQAYLRCLIIVQTFYW